MENSKIDVLEWDSLLLPKELSGEEKEKYELALSEYRDDRFINSLLQKKDTQKIAEVTIDDSFLKIKEVSLDRISHDELSTLLREAPIVIDSNVLFPKFEKINVLFWFLHNLAQQEISHSTISFVNQSELSIKFFQLVEAAVFFQFLDRGSFEERVVYLPTERYEAFLDKDIQGQYHMFLESLSDNQTISEILTIQLNTPIYDRISKQMVHNKLANDNNIMREGLSKEEIDAIVNKLRYWYLDIKKAVLES